MKEKVILYNAKKTQVLSKDLINITGLAKVAKASTPLNLFYKYKKPIRKVDMAKNNKHELTLVINK